MPRTGYVAVRKGGGGLPAVTSMWDKTSVALPGDPSQTC